MAIVKSKLLKQLANNYPNFLKKDLEKFTDIILAEIDFDKRKATLSIKLLEEIERKEALDKYGSEGSGKNLPFSSLSDDLEKKDKKDKKNKKDE